MRYYLIAGEASGDLHGSNLMKGILEADPQAEFRFWGGDKMAAVGGVENLAMHYKKASFMGFVEIARNARTILKQIDMCKKDVADYRPDVLILSTMPDSICGWPDLPRSRAFRPTTILHRKCGHGRRGV